MSNLSLPLANLLRENCSIVMNFCFSRRALEELVATKFKGEWKYLHDMLFSMPEQRATKACIELALFLRMFDDREEISEYLKQTSNLNFGRLVIENKPDKELNIRDVANKIIHADTLTWDFSVADGPRIVCLASVKEKEKWVRAEIDVVALAAFFGMVW